MKSNIPLKSREEVYLVAALTVLAVMVIAAFVGWVISIPSGVAVGFANRVGDIIIDTITCYVNTIMYNIFSMMAFTFVTFLILAEYERELKSVRPDKIIPILSAITIYGFYGVVVSYVEIGFTLFTVIVIPVVFCGIITGVRIDGKEIFWNE